MRGTHETGMPRRSGRWRTTPPLAVKFLIVIVPLLIGSGAVFATCLYVLERDEMRATLAAHMKTTAERNASILSKPMYDVEADGVQAIVTAMSVTPEIVCAEATLALTAGRYSWPRPGCIAARKNDAGNVSVPITYQGTTVGNLSIAYSYALLEAQLVHEIMRDLELTAVIVCITALAALLAFRLIIGRPLSRLLVGIRLAEHGDTAAAVDWPSRDEMGVVIAAFNTMNSQIATRTRELTEARGIAENASSAKTEFLANMSHELRTPLNAVIGFAQMLDYNPNEPLTAIQKKCMNRILKGGQHLLDLITDILDLSKIEAGRIDLSIETIVLGDLLEECRSYVSPLAQRHDISFHVAPCPKVSVTADYTRLKQVFLNLFSNAIKYNVPGGRVDVSCVSPGDGKISIIVADTGIGIPDDKRDDLFKPFSRLGQEGSAIEGTGIGLTITKRLLDMMNGSIDFDSVVGKGTTFHVDLSSAQSVGSVADSSPKVSPEAAADLLGTVVYVEDNPANIELMEMVFSRLGTVRLLTAPCGELGIDLVRDNRPNLVILDLNLPGMDGYEILRRLRAAPQTRPIPIFALTASATGRDIRKGLDAGFDRYLTKPFAIDALVDAMREVFETKERS